MKRKRLEGTGQSLVNEECWRLFQNADITNGGASIQYKGTKLINERKWLS